LSTGSGEVVCHLIDELLNVELFRREYQFNVPKFPQEEEFADEESGNGMDMEGTQEMHGIQI